MKLLPAGHAERPPAGFCIWGAISRNNINWAGVAFVASNRDTLLRVLREKGAKIDPDKLEAVHALPFEFKTWHELQKGRKRRFKGCDSGISAPEVLR